MTSVEDLLLYLGSDATDGLGVGPIPSKVDDDVRNLLEAILHADDKERSAIISLLTIRHGWSFHNFAERMASLAVRTADPKYLVEGVAALALAYPLLYWKESIPILSLLFWSGRKLGVDESVVFKTPVVADAEFEAQLHNFSRRSQDDRDIKKMSYVESCDDDGFRYESTW